MDNGVKILFPVGYDERAEFETSLKGCLREVLVEAENGSRYPVSFIDPVRLHQDMEEYVKLGKPFFSEPGLIILHEITSEAIRNAVTELWREGYFEHLRPLPSPVAAMAFSG